MDERKRFIRLLVAHEYPTAELARRFGVSRKTAYKWRERFLEGGIAALEDRSSARLTQPDRVVAEVEQAIVKARLARPNEGPRPLKARLEATTPDVRWPAASTIGLILRRHELIKPPRRREKCPPYTQPLSHADAPNQVWTGDFKGWFRTGDGSRCDPFTVADAFSRYALVIRSMQRTTGKAVWPVLEGAFREYGLPRVFRTDNGSPFAGCKRGGLTRFAVRLIRLGITPERIQPGHPEQNGRHERMHRTLKAETAIPPQRTLREQQLAFDRFRADYNEARPHSALGMRPPATVFSPSPRAYPTKIPELEYPADYELRRVRHNGEIRWRGQTVYINDALAGEFVGMRRVGDDLWHSYFGHVCLGAWDEYKQDWVG